MNVSSETMPRLVWLVLQDGSSVVAGCGTATRESIENAIAESELLTLTSDDRVDVLPSSAVREFVLFDMRSNVPFASAIYRLVQV